MSSSWLHNHESYSAVWNRRLWNRHGWRAFMLTEPYIQHSTFPSLLNCFGLIRFDSLAVLSLPDMSNRCRAIRRKSCKRSLQDFHVHTSQDCWVVGSTKDPIDSICRVLLQYSAAIISVMRYFTPTLPLWQAFGNANISTNTSPNPPSVDSIV